MDNFNRVISFILGLVVVIVFFAVVTGKIKLPGKTTSFFAAKPTPTPKVNSTAINNKNQADNIIDSQKQINSDISNQKPSNKTNKYNNPVNNNYQTNNNSSNIKTIPATGISTFFIPALLFGIVGGSFLRKSGQK